MKQTDFQKRAFLAAQAAHSAADRADARILMRIIEVVDEGDLDSLAQLAQALQKVYREKLGPVPGREQAEPDRAVDADGSGGSAG